jgi:hypothetical protein
MRVQHTQTGCDFDASKRQLESLPPQLCGTRERRGLMKDHPPLVKQGALDIANKKQYISTCNFFTLSILVNRIVIVNECTEPLEL